ncbi:MAG: hypothetical protein ABIH22_00730 [Candidatus Margulisiibacteriota bacterium]
MSDMCVHTGGGLRHYVPIEEGTDVKDKNSKSKVIKDVTPKYTPKKIGFHLEYIDRYPIIFKVPQEVIDQMIKDALSEIKISD